MKINEKQLTIIFCIVFALLIGVSLLFSQSPKDLPSAPQKIKHTVRNIAPLSSDDERFLRAESSEKLVPLSKKDDALIREMSASGTVKPLSAEEEAFIKR